MAARVVVVGASLGGLHALQVLLGGLDKSFPVPMAVVQHRGKSNPELLVNALQSHTDLVVNDAEDKQPLLPANVYIAPADYHLLLERGRCALSIEAPVVHSRPSIDVLFESAAVTYAGAVIAVVLTGNSSDGARGAALIKESGGTVVIQHPEDCEASMMPLAAMKTVDPDVILRLDEIAGFLKSALDCSQQG